MSDLSDSNFPTVSEGTIGGALVQTVDGRELHGSLKVGRDFPTWMKVRVEEYGFTEGVDFVRDETLSTPVSGSANARPQRMVVYHVGLDMAKELAMVERNEQGKKVRRYFIECEKRLRTGLSPALIEEMHRTNGICRMLSGKVTGIEKALPALATQIAAEILPAMVQAAVASQNFAIRRGMTAGQIWRAHGFPPIRVTCWFSNRLREMGCAIEGGGFGELGLTKARLFDPDKADVWLKNGGRLIVENKIADRRGQGVLKLVPKAVDQPQATAPA